VILLHPDDVARFGLVADERVTVRSHVGAMPNILVRPWDQIRAGNALMYCPEANVLVPRELDPASRTPAFKCVRVRIEKQRCGRDHGAGEDLPVVASPPPGREAGDGAVQARQRSC
jgi:formylmethanofuran dehydrogenase subunit D